MRRRGENDDDIRGSPLAGALGSSLLAILSAAKHSLYHVDCNLLHTRLRSTGHLVPFRFLSPPPSASPPPTPRRGPNVFPLCCPPPPPPGHACSGCRHTHFCIHATAGERAQRRGDRNHGASKLFVLSFHDKTPLASRCATLFPGGGRHVRKSRCAAHTSLNLITPSPSFIVLRIR